MRGVLVLIGLAGAATLAAIATPLHDQPAPTPTVADIRRLEARLGGLQSESPFGEMAPPGEQSGMPAWSLPLDRYVRHYAIVSLRSEEDLPFTTIFSVPPDAPEYAGGFTGRRIAGILQLEGEANQRAGVVLSHRQELPMIFHGGCAIVNVVYDPQADRLVAAWCNYDDRPTPAPLIDDRPTAFPSPERPDRP